MLILGAKLLARRTEKLGWIELLAIVGIGMAPAFLVVVEPDLGTGLNILLLLFGLILYRGISGPVFKTLLVAVPILLPCGWFLLKPYQKQRILTLRRSRRKGPLGSGYHTHQSRIAIGSGQMWARAFSRAPRASLR